MILNKKEIEAAGAEEYALWRSTKDRVNSIKEYMVANATTHLNRLDKAANLDNPTGMLDLFGPGGGIVGSLRGTAKNLRNRKSKYNRSHGSKHEAPSNVKTYSKEEVDALNKELRKKKGPVPDYTPKAKKTEVANNTGDVTQQLEFNKNIDILEYFKPVKTKAQMAAAVNALKHRFSNYDKIIRGIGKNNYNKMQERIYGGLEEGLIGGKMDQHGQWARELYVEKMRGLGVL